MEREVINHFSIRGGTQIDIRRSFFIGYLDYEAGDRLPDVMTILHLAAFYDVSVDYILGQTENMQRYPLS